MENLTGQTVWITKYALTTGIFTGVVNTEPGSSELINLKCHPYNYYRIGQDAFLTEDEAKAQARVMKDKKIKSLEKQIKKLKQMEF